ncbi:phage protein NinX family protein [Rosenbergiella epipactidis]|uniref:phage protein NinX family protein n=1 Tax=Rosenbergiella epipactidis TaxID=1544694 RepID=UPI001F4DBB1D|nr:phage protein NinX family protein [Rosenbergiella epipactidis]
MNYQEMSDKQIMDLAVYEIVFGKTYGKIVSYAFDEPKFVFTESGHTFTPLDNEKVELTPKIKPTSSWADAGPIIQDNTIPLNPFRDGWVAGERRNVRDKNPLRAAMVVFLMMKGGE